MNQISLTGRLTKDPVASTSQSGKEMSRFSIAVDRRGGEKTDFFNCTAFGSNANFINSYGKKGRLAEVTGRVELNEWTDREGTKRLSPDVICENAGFLDPKPKADPAQEAPAPAEGASNGAEDTGL